MSVSPSARRTVLFAGEAGAIRETLGVALRQHGVHLVSTPALSDTLAACHSCSGATVVVLSLASHDDAAGLEALQQVREYDGHAPVILLTAAGSEALAVAALRAGVKDYFQHPVSVAELIAAVIRCLGGADGSGSAAAGSGSPVTPLIGDSHGMRRIRGYIARVAASDASVIITGETGTGKEIVAQMVHDRSRRRSGPFVAVNCAAIPDSLIESELFGHERGAFTGAHATRDGQLRHAHGGTLLLDEIGDMGPFAQAKILRALEQRQVIRIGGRHAMPIDVRVVAATNHDLEADMEGGRFRKDLYFRLNVARIHLPPLRDRREDIPALFRYYMAVSARRRARQPPTVSDAAMRYLTSYQWPGNIRELKNLVEAVFLNDLRDAVTPSDLPDDFRRRAGDREPVAASERELVVNALLEARGNKSRAAEKLRMSRMTLYRKLSKYSGPGV
jgi:DNA-binding NtrC family response regulator